MLMRRILKTIFIILMAAIVYSSVSYLHTLVTTPEPYRSTNPFSSYK